MVDKKDGRGGDEEAREEDEDDDRELLPSVEMLGADEERFVFPLRDANDCRICLGSDDAEEEDDEEVDEEVGV